MSGTSVRTPSDYVNGKWVRSDGSWEAGVERCQGRHPHEGGSAHREGYRQEYYAGHAEDMAKVIATKASVTVPYGTFAHALVTSEWTPLESGVRRAQVLRAWRRERQDDHGQGRL